MRLTANLTLIPTQVQIVREGRYKKRMSTQDIIGETIIVAAVVEGLAVVEEDTLAEVVDMEKGDVAVVDEKSQMKRKRNDSTFVTLTDGEVVEFQSSINLNMKTANASWNNAMHNKKHDTCNQWECMHRITLLQLIIL